MARPETKARVGPDAPAWPSTIKRAARHESQERRVKPRRADDATRITLVPSRLTDWRAVLTIVKPDTLIRWHRKGFRLFWRWTSRARGRLRLPVDRVGHVAASNVAQRDMRRVPSLIGPSHVVDPL